MWPPETSRATVGSSRGSLVGAGVVQQVGSDVADEVVDGVERLAERQGEGLGGADADHEGSGEAGSARDRDRIDLGECHARLGERSIQSRAQRLEVGAGRDLWHDAAVAGVLLHRAGDRVGEQLGAAHDADAGLVAAGLDAEHERAGGHAIPVRGVGIVSFIDSASIPPL